MDGPHFSALVEHRLAVVNAPVSAIVAASIPDSVMEEVRKQQAVKWALEVIRLVQASSNNHWGQDAEAIAAGVLRHIRNQQDAAGI